MSHAMMETLTATEVATILKMTPKTVIEKARKGIIPALKPGRTWLFIRNELFSWMEQESQKPKLKADHIKNKIKEATKLCQSKDVKEVRPITQISRITAKELENLLEPPTKLKRKSMKIS